MLKDGTRAALSAHTSFLVMPWLQARNTLLAQGRDKTLTGREPEDQVSNPGVGFAILPFSSRSSSVRQLRSFACGKAA
jgi:hypothetical protein